jgi:nicotinate-nucleotide pyrophosphorylase (carboxylating)
MKRLLGTFDAGFPAPEELDPVLVGALAEDHAFDDRSTRPLSGAAGPALGRVLAREAGTLAGAPVFRRVFELLAAREAGDGPVAVTVEGLADGAVFAAGDEVLTLRGPGGVLLSGERTALNFLQRLSGVATRTAACVAATAGRIAVCDTRKTTPGLRALEKYAVVVGGGRSHRWHLGDMVMLKENHLAVAGGIVPALAAIRADPRSAALPVTVEVRTEAEALAAADAGVDRILLDNMSPDEMGRIASDLAGRPERPELEASGGLGPADLGRIAETGVDLVSLGSLTHSVKAVDFSLLLELGIDR